MRKIIHLSTGISERYPALALCDDGTTWIYYVEEPGNERWRVLSPIPQKEVPNETPSA